MEIKTDFGEYHLYRFDKFYILFEMEKNLSKSFVAVKGSMYVSKILSTHPDDWTMLEDTLIPKIRIKPMPGVSESKFRELITLLPMV